MPCRKPYTERTSHSLYPFHCNFVQYGTRRTIFRHVPTCIPPPFHMAVLHCISFIPFFHPTASTGPVIVRPTKHERKKHQHNSSTHVSARPADVPY